MSIPVAALAVSLAGVVACPSSASPPADESGITATPVTPAAEASVVGKGADDEIVVTADRYGEAQVASESEFSEKEIAGQGADSIEQLLQRLAPFIDGSGEEPVVLVNGKPIGFDRSILAYPAEALDRLAVLKPEAAAQYGEPPNKRVVNLVLKKKFSQLNLDAGAGWATAGGQYGGDLAVARTAISGALRWNAGLRIDRDSALRRDARRLPPRPGAFDRTGFVTAVDGGEIDPALSAAAGEVVTVAAIPAVGMSGSPGLADFVAGAGITDPVDPDRLETIQPSRQSIALSLGLTRPLGSFSASFSLKANRSSSRGWRGLPMASVVVPPGHPSSPFAEEVVLTRPFAGLRALRIYNRAENFGGTLTLNGAIAGWQTSIAISYARNWGEDIFETGIDIGRVRTLIESGDPDFNPFGAWDEALLLGRHNRSSGTSLNGRLQVQKAVTQLPAGPLGLNVSLNASQSRAERWLSENGSEPLDPIRATRRQTSGQLSLSIPLSRRGTAEIGPLGDVSLDLSMSGQTMRKAPLQKRFGGGVNWSPLPIVQFRAALDHVEIAPSFEQLDGPTFTIVRRLFDYARGEVAEPVWTIGGNPGLDRGSRQNLSLNAFVRPLEGQTLSLTLGYQQMVAKGAIAALPELTPAIEAAFSERVTRDAEGRLVAVDARPINLARETSAGLTSGIALRFPLGGQRGALPSDPIQVAIALNHSMRLKSEMVTHPGVPVIDQLTDSGQSRHTLSLQVTAGKRGIGATLNGNWSSPARLVAGERSFRFKPPMIFNLSLFAEPDHLFGRAAGRKQTNGFKLSFDVQNLFNGYRRVTLPDGSVPAGYSRDEIDPLGRTVRLTVRKKF